MRKLIGVAMIFSLLAGAGWLYAYRQYDNNYQKDNLIRLHVIANSNTFYDQDLKYRVKDRIVRETASIFNAAANIEEARDIADANKEKIRRIALDEIHNQGFDYPVQVVRGNFDFPEKTYTIKNAGRVTSLTLPPGRYEAVRVIIGSGRGANWWCVLYPPLCFVNPPQGAAPTSLPYASAVEKTPDRNNNDKNPGEARVEYRFRIVELFKSFVS
ncbi:stage II sporulation protein R [Desulfoscipio geothermicus]|uniref:Stage II sporulation protein R n=1 Tax=Desulfoscipio geothermicus DSM 3669 TaxID=1121426 RepID=A0A1I6DGB4_9FIRM|nr:stage II sporulation protein R [Desulfoscipio geothermicus]SFR04483.1 stage II sporulation protein R [Desulfoscipio geothermicus DSM 3669]